MTVSIAVPTLIIDTPAALESAIAVWKTRDWLAVDTEFVREDTYHARLCLVQIGDGETAACIDTLAVDLAPLWPLLADERIVKVLHSASQDYEIFAELSGDCPRPLFDTQVAATILGIGDQIGYAGLVKAMLDIEVDKSLSRTNWAKRPIPQPAIEYAADDVRHLAVIYPELLRRLDSSGRIEWLEADCAALTDPAMYRTEPEDAWKRLRGLARLPPVAQHRAAALADWRERRAVERNRPRRWMLSDDALYALAVRAPDSLDDLAAVGDLPATTRERHGAVLLEVLAGATRSDQPLVADERPDAAYKSALQSLQAVVRERAQVLAVPPSLLARRSDLEALLHAGESADIAPLRGWRRELIGGALLQALSAPH
ncbi:ribonuclease D [Algiphilus sp. W345]|uniref:Ribonuclease D n=1 Tax=Banduia mediterranea TaxID=3075609 RepID=A0ABU2WHT4_9GAMM|nr:ribonuclease D [Algiphilus sp. W345]MDT0496831.1 ribonuclease D [Algiphilus sp. W345]